jgi:hypothetical protein
MIDVTCKCGHSFAANGRHAGLRVRCPECKFPTLVPDAAPAAPAPGEVPWNSFERHLSKQLDQLGGLAFMIAHRLGWIVFLLCLLVAGCTFNALVIQQETKAVRVIGR